MFSIKFVLDNLFVLPTPLDQFQDPSWGLRAALRAGAGEVTGQIIVTVDASSAAQASRQLAPSITHSHDVSDERIGRSVHDGQARVRG